MRLVILATVGLLSAACAREEDRTVGMPPAEPSAQQTTPDETRGSVPEAPTVTVQLAPTQGNDVAGELRLTAEGEGVRVTGMVSGLEPDSTHGIHIHEKGDCSAPDASSAGEHFGPLGNPHGAPGPGTHVGDLGNITANETGVAPVDVRSTTATLRSGAATDVSGRAVIVHANPDDLQTQPSGDSGSRVACGVIT